jgi:hypothetical protein
MSAYEFGSYLGLLTIVFCIVLIPTIFFYLTQQNTLKAIQPANRLMEPGMVLATINSFVWNGMAIHCSGSYFRFTEKGIQILAK